MSWRFSPWALPLLVAENAPGATFALSLPVALTEAQACQGPGGVAVSGA